MSDTGIPKTGSGVPPLPQQRQEFPARVESATGDLAHLLRPTRIEGIVTGQNNGIFHIRTDRGELDVRLRASNLPANGQRVEVELHAGHPPRQAVVRAIHDQGTSPSPSARAAPVSSDTVTTTATPLADSLRTALSEQAPPSPSAQATEPVTIQPGDLVRLAPMTPEEAEATIADSIVSKAALQMPPATLVFKTTAEAAENLKLLIELPTDQGATLRPRAPGESAHVLLQPRISSLPVILEATAAPLAKAITPLTALDIRVTSVTQPAVKLLAPGTGTEKTPPSANPFFSASMPATALDKAKAAHAGLPLPTVVPPPNLATGPAGSLSGTVIGHTQENFPVLAVILPGQTLPAHFAIQLNTDNLPDGAVVNFIPHATAVDLPDVEAPPQSSDLVPAFQWAAFSNIKAVVTQIDPRIVQAFTQTLPNAAAPEQIPAAALFFVAALRSGDIASWLGDKTIEALKRAGRGDTIDKLSKEMNDAGKADSSKAPGEWHSLPLPIVAGGDIQRMMLYYRHDREREDNDGDGQRLTRFIFDMDLTRMGVVQLDGLHRPAGRESKLDLIVRTGAPLSQTMQQSMRRAYTKALESTGHTGEMSFQNRPEQFVKVGKGA